MAREPQPYMQNRELSWLTFNERVLEEARDPSNPLAERLKFVSIFTSNLDEFFMIRVGSLYDMAVMGDDQVDSRTGLLPSQQLEAIYRRAVLLMEQRDQVYAQLQTQLQAYGVCEVSPGQLAGKDKDFLKTYFKTQLLPILSPQIIDGHHPFPHLANKVLHIGALLQILLVRLIQIAREKAADAVAPQELLKLPADVILFRNQRLDGGKNGLQLLFGGKAGFIVWGVPLDQGQVQQASHANHEKLIQIAGENGDKFEPLQQGNLLIQGLQKHTFIESEPGELPVLGIEGVGISFGHSRSPLSSGS